MSTNEAQDRGLRLVPAWWPVAIAFGTGLVSFGSSYAAVNFRLAVAESDLAAMKQDRKEALRDWSQWRAVTDIRVQRSEDGVASMGKTLDRLADHFGILH
jgi:hypothetical protein